MSSHIPLMRENKKQEKKLSSPEEQGNDSSTGSLGLPSPSELKAATLHSTSGLTPLPQVLGK